MIRQTEGKLSLAVYQSLSMIAIVIDIVTIIEIIGNDNEGDECWTGEDVPAANDGRCHTLALHVKFH